MKNNYHSKDIKRERQKRLNSKSLKAVLLYKFVSEYGYGQGMVAAKAIVEDIVKLVEGYYVEQSHIKVGEMLWVAAVKGQTQFYGRNINNTKKKVIKLSVFNDADIEKLGAKTVNFKDLNLSRVIRWINEANQQDACLTIEDLSALGAVNISELSSRLKKYQTENNKTLPLRGYLEDIGRGTTHKKQIINLHLQKHLSPSIARMTSHSKDAVDRYINDYQIISMLSEKFDKEIIPTLARKSKSLVEEYMKICQSHNKSSFSVSKLSSVSVK